MQVFHCVLMCIYINKIYATVYSDHQLAHSWYIRNNAIRTSHQRHRSCGCPHLGLYFGSKFVTFLTLELLSYSTDQEDYCVTISRLLRDYSIVVYYLTSMSIVRIYIVPSVMLPYVFYPLRCFWQS